MVNRTSARGGSASPGVHKVMKDDTRKVERAIFAWLDPVTSLRAKRLVAIQEVVQYGIPRGQFLRYIDNELAASDSWRAMPFATLLMVIYACSAIMHEDAPNVRAVQSALETRIVESATFAFSNPDMGHKNVYNVSTHDDFWAWLSEGFIPIVFGSSSSEDSSINKSAVVVGTSENATPTNMGTSTTLGTSTTMGTSTIMGTSTTSAPENATASWKAGSPTDGIVLHYARLVGGVRMRQEVSGKDPEADDMLPTNEELLGGRFCNTMKMLLNVYGETCVGGHGYELDPEKDHVHKFGTVAREHWFYVHQSLDDIQGMVSGLMHEGWLDRRTRRIEISVPQYNAEYGIYTVTSTNFFFSRGGRIWKAVASLSTHADWYPYVSYMAVDGVFVSCLAWIIWKELRHMRKIAKESGFCVVIWTYKSLWKMVDWISLIMGAVLIALLNANIGFTMRLNQATADFAEVAKTTGPPGTDDWKNHLRRVLEALEEQIRYCERFRFVMSTYPLVVILRMLRAFAAQPQLATVTNIMSAAKDDLLHYFVVFGTIFASYTISATSLMGRDVESFTTLVRTTNQLFRALVGNLSWGELKNAGRYEAAVWIMFFETLLICVLFNLLIAIVMESYETVRHTMAGVQSFPEEIVKALRDKIGVMQKNLVAMPTIRQVIADDEKICVMAHLQSMKTRPPSAETNWIVARNEIGDKVTWACYSRYSFHDTTEAPEPRNVQVDDASGTIVVLDGMGGQFVLKEGDELKFAVNLDEDDCFHWFVDTSKVARDEKAILQSLQTIHKESQADLVTPGYLMNKVQGMRPTQARDLVTLAVKAYYVSHAKAEGLEEMRTYVAHLDHRTAKLLSASLGIRKAERDAEENQGNAGANVPNATEVADVGASQGGQDTGEPVMGEELKRLRSVVDEALVAVSLDNPGQGDASRHVHPTVPKQSREGGLTIDKLHIGCEVVVLDNVRKVLSACHHAGLAPANAEWRKRALGRTGFVQERDPYDGTVAVQLPGLGVLWFAVGALRLAGQVPEEPEAEEMSDRDRRRRREYRARRREFHATRGEMEARVQDLEKKLQEIEGTRMEAITIAEELRQRLDKRLQQKTRCECEIQALEAQCDDATRRNKAGEQAVYAASSEDQENAVLRRQLAEERHRYEALSKDWELQSGELRRRTREAHAEIERTRATRQHMELQLQTDVAWIAGRADAVARALAREGCLPNAERAMRGLRDFALETERRPLVSHVTPEG